MVKRATDLRVVGIGGSLREGSYSYVSLEHVIALVTRMGCSAQIIDLRNTRLPFCNGDRHELWPSHPGVAELRRLVSTAHALVLATPEYHGGISGVLKNALDLLDEDHVAGKV